MVVTKVWGQGRRGVTKRQDLSVSAATLMASGVSLAMLHLEEETMFTHLELVRCTSSVKCSHYNKSAKDCIIKLLPPKKEGK